MEKWASIRASSSAMTDLMQCVNGDYCAFLIRDSKYEATMRCHNTIDTKNTRRIPIRFFSCALFCPRQLECKWDLCQCVLSFSAGGWRVPLWKPKVIFFLSSGSVFGNNRIPSGETNWPEPCSKLLFAQYSLEKQNRQSRTHDTAFSMDCFLRSITKQNRRRETKEEEIAKISWLTSSESFKDD